MLFSPLSHQALQLESRTWVPAMVPWRATESGFVTPDNLDWYARFARGCPAALVVEATGIRDIASGPLLRVSHARFIPGLKELVTPVRGARGGRTRLFLQLIDFNAICRLLTGTETRYRRGIGPNRKYVTLWPDCRRTNSARYSPPGNSSH